MNSAIPPEVPPNTGIFDLPDSQGLNPSERILARLCRKSFLSLWAYPNLHTDEGKRNDVVTSSKEFTDLLVVFGNDVILFSDKHVAYDEGKPVEVAWRRWFKRAVRRSAHQLFGALNWLQRFPDRLFLDANCSRRIPIEIPGPSHARYHLVAATRGTFDACSRYYRGSPGGYLNFPHLWPGQTPPPGDGGTRDDYAV